MGFFSWKTQDTGKSIANSYSSQKTFDVWMHDDKGNKWKESNYEGYGDFGGKDFYELLAEMNGLKTRDEGISLSFSKQPYKSPNLSESADWKYTDAEPSNCEHQGYFY
jgi:hypothetical protein